MADLQWKDNAESVLTANILNTDVPATVSVTAGHGAKFPALTGSQWFPIIIVDETTAYEELKVTARATDTMTATRAQGGTTARNFSIGDAVYLPFVKSVLDQLLYIQDAANGKPHWCGAAGGTTNARTLSGSPAFTALVDGMLVSFRSGANNSGAMTLDVDGLGVKSLLQVDGSALVSGMVKNGGHYLAQYNGTAWILLNGYVPNTISTALTISGALNIAGATIDLIPSGMQIQMFQTTIPTGWTLVSSNNDRVIINRSTNTVAGGTGGSWTISGISGDPVTLTGGQSGIQTHDHSFSYGGDDSTGRVRNSGSAAPSGSINTGNSGTSSALSSHSHGLTIGSAWRPSYVYAYTAQRS